MARESTISKTARFGSRSLLALAIGQALRSARRGKGFTQAALGAPFSAAFVSRVEKGHAMPSLSALAILLDRLDLSFDEFFAEVAVRQSSLLGSGGATPDGGSEVESRVRAHS